MTRTVFIDKDKIGNDMKTDGNLTVDILARRIYDLRESRKSGLVAYLPYDNSRDGEEYCMNDHMGIVYFYELDTVFFTFLEYQSYYGFKESKSLESSLKDYIKESGGAESKVKNPDEYLSTAYSTVIWEMTHDSEECPDLDNDDYDGHYKSYNPEFMDKWEAYNSFRLCGEETVGQDILAFRKKLVSGEHLTITGKDGSVYEFSLERDDQATEYSDYNTVFSLIYCAHEIYQDETDGPIPVIVYHKLLRTTEFNTLYAKSKTFIFLNFI